MCTRGDLNSRKKKNHPKIESESHTSITALLILSAPPSSPLELPEAEPDPKDSEKCLEATSEDACSKKSNLQHTTNKTPTHHFQFLNSSKVSRQRK